MACCIIIADNIARGAIAATYEVDCHDCLTVNAASCCAVNFGFAGSLGVECRDGVALMVPSGREREWSNHIAVGLEKVGVNVCACALVFVFACACVHVCTCVRG